MAIHVRVPISTNVIECNPDCTIDGVYENGRLVVKIDTRNQNHHQRLGLPTRTRLYWGKEYQFDAQELSGFSWPMRYRIFVREGYYFDNKDQRKHFVTGVNGVDGKRKVSTVLMRAAVLLLVMGGVGYRLASWLLNQLFHVDVSKSSLQRWVKEVASTLPHGNELIKQLHAVKPITEFHFDEIFPLGLQKCVLVFKDEHGRIIDTEAIDSRDEENVKTFLKRIQSLGLPIQSFYVDGCKTYWKAIRSVFGQSVSIQYDYFHIIQNAWRHMWKWAVSYRKNIKEESEKPCHPMHQEYLEDLAKNLWKNRYLLFKNEKNMTDEEKGILNKMLENDIKTRNLRSFLKGVWRIFEDSEDEAQARQALEELKKQPIDRSNPEPFAKVISFLEDYFPGMTTFLRDNKVKRYSLAETGMRTLRRLEVAHDGFRSDDGRKDFLRIYQAVKYLGWSVCPSTDPVASSAPG